jgi:hypothetical protein
MDHAWREMTPALTKSDAAGEHTALRRTRRRRALAATPAALLATLAGGFAWASADSGPGRAPQELQGRALAVELARLRKVASPGAGWPALRAARPDPIPQTTVGVWTGEVGPRVPSDFLGLSFEATALTSIHGLTRSGTLTRLLSSLGRGTLHFGGGTVNRYVAWTEPGTPRPGWANHAVSPTDLQTLAALAHQTGWKVLLDTNFAHYEPVASAQEATSAHRQLGASLLGIAFGNEPDRFARFGLRAPRWGFSGYERQLGAYRHAIAASIPGAQIAAPEASTGEALLPWVWESIGLHPAILTDHYYPLTSCGEKPTITELLSPAVRLKETVMLHALRDIQSTAGRPLLLDETNNVSCKGEPGVSNTFASALWAADFIARAMSAGLRGVDFHNLLNRPLSYSPLVGEGSSLRANPEWYALLLTHSLQGAHALPTVVSSPSQVSAQAFELPDGKVEVLLVNFDIKRARPMRVTVKLYGRSGDGTVLRLTAPGVSSTTGVRLGGESVGTSGTWRPRAPLQTVHVRNGTLALPMPAASAALVTIAPNANPQGVKQGSTSAPGG